MITDWLPFAGHEVSFVGIDGSGIHLTSHSVLSREIDSRGLISFDATLNLKLSTGEMKHSFKCTLYGGASSLLQSLNNFCDRKSDSVEVMAEFLAFTIANHRHGVRDRTIIEGYFASSGVLDNRNQLSGSSIRNQLVQDGHSWGSLKFAFLSSVIDPPLIYHAVRQLSGIVNSLHDEGFTRSV